MRSGAHACAHRRLVAASPSRAAPVCARRSAARPDAVQDAVRDLALGQQRQVVRDPSAARIVDPVRVGAEARTRAPRRRWRRAGRRPCGASFSAARSSEPVSAAKPTRTGRGGRGSRGGRRSARARPRDLGEDVRRRLELEGEPARRARASCRRLGRGRKSATAAAMTRTSKPRAVPASGVDDARRACVGGRSRRATTRAAVRERDLDTCPATSVTSGAARQGGLRDRDAHPARATGCR